MQENMPHLVESTQSEERYNKNNKNLIKKENINTNYKNYEESKKFCPKCSPNNFH
jgi:hypothetical protein